ncbi:MAG: UDP-N-acetylmuramate--L-alanine ligase [Planctomycetaceae bacterium]|nr:UDP-N-acetylmuramate--L-alanine ligase [Planctomycetaceae bacterium]
MGLDGRRIHFMGVGGIGVSALAGFARHRGATVSGCDRQESSITRRLRAGGIPVAIGHDPAHAGTADLLVYSSAVPPDHPERAAATAQASRGAFLSDLMHGMPAWGVAGTHGKTTTTWLLAHILIQAGLDPSVFIGGVVPQLPEGNYRLGEGVFVTELDESDATFLLPRLQTAVVTNVESDHLSHYGDDAALFAAFRRFIAGVADGLLVAGWDRLVLRRMYLEHPGKKLSFGVEAGADLVAHGCSFSGGGVRFEATLRGASLGRFEITLPGMHNVQNALAALGAAVENGVDVDIARDALRSAKGVERRMEPVGMFGNAVVYSDYAHHPTEVAAAITALRQNHPGATLVVFQPHLFSRTRDYAVEFAQALAKADRLLVVDIYPAREEPIPGVDAGLIVPSAGPSSLAGPVPLAEVAEALPRLANGCEAILMMGAGDIDAAARSLVAPVAERR